MTIRTKEIIHKLTILILSGLSGLTLYDTYEKIMGILDVVMPMLSVDTMHQAKEYWELVAMGILFGAILCIMVIGTYVFRKKQRFKAMLAATIFAHAFIILIVCLSTVEIYQSITTWRIYALDDDCWLLATFYSGLIGGYIYIPAMKVIWKVEKVVKSRTRIVHA